MAEMDPATAETGARRHVRLGLIALLLTLAIDQGFKLWMIHGFDIADRGIVAVGPYLDLVMAWNKGISYGLFQQDGETGRWVLVGIKAVAAVVFGAWLLRAETRPTAIGLGLIIGGALGNAIDRVAWGAVADFFSFHVGTFRWYVFNLADAAIVLGVILLLYDALFGPAAKKPA
ncbi:signal peptidase II [Blastochloris tepida]|uniref:Lipoprotein signal peptidase n=1 Tax=Blastochloris tepida TaxID=2233851 RepID=A0A348FVZ6_9HYPH|nr:signal peptidase II [Blastochloris tepida]BBF91479.1 lipoprotein signal peptidase [Blastochloris tepida]